MKKRFWILAALLTLTLLAAVTAAAVCTAPAPEEEPPAAQVSDGYILTASEGTLGLYRDGELILRTDIPLASLRQVDRVQVEAGIRLSTFEEALMLLEDFGA